MSATAIDPCEATLKASKERVAQASEERLSRHVYSEHSCIHIYRDDPPHDNPQSILFVCAI
jgi:hypothetical protein